MIDHRPGINTPVRPTAPAPSGRWLSGWSGPVPRVEAAPQEGR
jgi:hypothetical protein